MPLELEVREEGGSIVVALIGEIDAFSSGQLEESLRVALSACGPGPLTVDCSRLGFIDGRGISTLAAACAALPGEGRVALRRPTRVVRTMVDLLDLGEVFVIEPADA